MSVLAFLLPAASAAASTGLEPGVQIDPGSPAAKQYVLQLNQARQTGAQGSHSRPNGGLFGAGITPSGGGGSGGGGATHGSAGQTSRGQARGRAHHAPGTEAATSQTAPASLPPAVLRAAHTQGSSAGSGTWLALLGGGVVILLLGGFGGTVLRHNRRPRPSS
jgi:hypothetical protein